MDRPQRGRGRRGGRGRRRDDRRRDRRPRPNPEEHLSRFLAFILRHHPEEVGLELDEEGAVDLDALTEAVRARSGFEDVTRERIEGLVAGPGSARFERRDDRVRARYGHSFDRPIRYEEAEPPEDLFHGTTPDAAEEILREGLEPGERQYVHLSFDTPAAREVGRRRTPEPVILRVDTVSARKADVRFFRAGPAVWLSDPIPPECITRYE